MIKRAVMMKEYYFYYLWWLLWVRSKGSNCKRQLYRSLQCRTAYDFFNG